MTSKFPQFLFKLMSFIFMTFTFVSLMGLFVSPLGDYKHFACMGVNDGVFVPPSDVYIAMGTFVLPMGCLCLHGVTCLYEDLDMCLDVCRFMTPEDLDMCLDVCRFMTPEYLNMRLYECRFMTPEDLNMANGGLKCKHRGSYDNLWCLLTDERRRARTQRTEHRQTPRTFSPARAAYLSSRMEGSRRDLEGHAICSLWCPASLRAFAMWVCPPIYRFCGGHTGGGTLPGGGLAGTSVEAERERRGRWRTGGGAHARGLTGGGGAPVRGLTGGPLWLADGGRRSGP
ncbi:hypothetical protein Taro_055543 [Colocasia esculenta]|uniref:Uncharacterized protein n=1 Tax=Colocasia esculenta TaxID=4460 RepID=A0A843XTZ1_COLES|nr:hypothetical protein [Colocasia esculenta]